MAIGVQSGWTVLKENQACREKRAKKDKQAAPGSTLSRQL
ncbi:hypothetical protein GWI33_012829, partial [Rhynchophorus ferrugineus]